MLVQVVPGVTKTLVGASHRIHPFMADRAGGIVHGWIVGVSQRNRISGSGR